MKKPVGSDADQPHNNLLDACLQPAKPNSAPARRDAPQADPAGDQVSYTQAQPASSNSAAARASAAARTPEARDREAQRRRSVALLTDDRAEHLVPSIRMVEITEAARDGSIRVLRPATVMKSEWKDPDDVERAGLPARRIRGIRRSSMLAHLQKRGTPLSSDQVAAGELYEIDWELSQRGGFPSGPAPEIKCAPGPGDYSRQIDHGRSFRKASAVIGPLGRHLLQFILLGVQGAPPGDITGWADTRKAAGDPDIGRKAAVGVLIATLDLLVGHYGRRAIAEHRKRADE